MNIRPDNLNAVENQFDLWTIGIARRPTRRKTLQLLSGGFLATLLGLRGPKSWAASSITSASTPNGTHDDLAATSASNGLSICHNQQYALCTGALCLVYNNVAYCRCNVLFGDSISRTLSYPDGNVCDFNAEGANNGYMVSTFSVPPASVSSSGDQALYFCPPSPKSGYYASCDGGICFTSSRGRSFPRLGQLDEDQIVCACMIASGSSSIVGHQIFGPHPCQPKFFDNCTSAVATGANGSYLLEGATTGSYGIGALELDRAPAHFNICL